MQRKSAAWDIAGAGKGHEGRIERLHVRGARHRAGGLDEGDLIRADKRERDPRRAIVIESAQIDHHAALRVEEV